MNYVHFFKQRKFLIFIFCNKNVGSFGEHYLLLFLFIFLVLCSISAPLFHFYLFLEVFICSTDLLFKQNEGAVLADDEDFKGLSVFLIVALWIVFPRTEKYFVMLINKILRKVVKTRY